MDNPIWTYYIVVGIYQLILLDFLKRESIGDCYSDLNP